MKKDAVQLTVESVRETIAKRASHTVRQSRQRSAESARRVKIQESTRATVAVRNADGTYTSSNIHWAEDIEDTLLGEWDGDGVAEELATAGDRSTIDDYPYLDDNAAPAVDSKDMDDLRKTAEEALADNLYVWENDQWNYVSLGSAGSYLMPLGHGDEDDEDEDDENEDD